MKNGCCDLFFFKSKHVTKCLTFMAVIGVIIFGMCFSLYALSPGEPAIQLLKDRALTVLRDSFIATENHNMPDTKSHLTISNKTMTTLTIELNGQNGKHTLMVQPKTKHTWRIENGSYHFEASIPGFPTTGGEIVLSPKVVYSWEIWRSEL